MEGLRGGACLLLTRLHRSWGGEESACLPPSGAGGRGAHTLGPATAPLSPQGSGRRRWLKRARQEEISASSRAPASPALLLPPAPAAGAGQ
jgi:hypothetical protein